MHSQYNHTAATTASHKEYEHPHHDVHTPPHQTVATGTSAHDPITVDTATEDDQQSHFGDYFVNPSFDTFSDHLLLSPVALSPTIIREPVGDISPIQVSYGRCTQALFEDASVIPDDWKQQAATSSSDPLRVLDAAQDAFAGLKYVIRSVQTNAGGSSNQYSDSLETSYDKKIAMRRVETAVCAFGGQVAPTPVSSIFRPKESSSRNHYNDSLSRRYKTSGSEIQWDVEENPPVVISPSEEDDEERDYKKMKLSESLSCMSDRSKSSESHDSNKMKYHCKRCGQLKQNHLCPYRQPLQRSIGVMVFPAVNSYTAAEPGTVAAPLTQMNNFVSYDAEEQTSPKSHSVQHFPSAITPDAQQGFFQSPQSSMSVQSSEDRDVRGLKRNFGSLRTSTSEGGSTLFAETVALKPEHYRAVTTPSTEGGHSYPSIPVSFAERKRLSDTLFYLAREIPCLVNECAVALRSARNHCEWDLAVAELLTQVVVGLYCAEGDCRLDGLQQYLLSLGVSC